MKDFPEPHLKCSTANVILHAGAINSTNNLSNVILSKLLLPKNWIHTELPECNVILLKK